MLGGDDMGTRETISSTALALFSQKGYADASIRDICKLVGIKESSLYFHFKNKQAILDELTEDFVRGYSAALEDFAGTFRRMSYLTPDLFRGVIRRFVSACYMDESLNRYLCILIHEQGQNEPLRKVFRKWIYDEPIELLKEMFITLIELGFIRRISVSFLAEAFYYPLVSLFLEYMTLPDPKNFESAYLEYINKFLKEFMA